jgi:hypothetical protein
MFFVFLSTSTDVVSKCNYAVNDGGWFISHCYFRQDNLVLGKLDRGGRVNHMVIQVDFQSSPDAMLYHREDDRDVRIAAEDEDAVTGQVKIKCRLEDPLASHHTTSNGRSAGIGIGVVDLTCRVREVLFSSTSHQLAFIVLSAPWYHIADTLKNSLRRGLMN